MNERFMFRAWDSMKKEMLDAVDLNEICIFNGGLGLSENYIIEQSTGLRDKNGKPIFEGDVVLYSFEDKHEALVVYFSLGNQQTMLMRDSTRVTDLDHLTARFCEIIGNIHSNAEMLGGEV